MALAWEKDVHWSSTYGPGNITTSITRIACDCSKYRANNAATAASPILAAVPSRPNTDRWCLLKKTS